MSNIPILTIKLGQQNRVRNTVWHDAGVQMGASRLGKMAVLPTKLKYNLDVHNYQEIVRSDA
jgi:hypothetical protein